MDIFYKKNKNDNLFNLLSSEEFTALENPQNYIPIYNRFFNLNSANYNSINLNNKYKLHELKTKINYSKFDGIIIDDSNNKLEKKIFFKYSPIVDPIKYMIGKYDSCHNILELPQVENRTNNKIEKIYDENNAAYSDGFFSFLSSMLLHNYNFYNGIDYYGSFLGIKKEFVVDIEDDIESLDDSDFFYKNNNTLFRVLNSDKIQFNNSRKIKQRLIIDNDDNIDNDSNPNENLEKLLNIRDLNINEYSESTDNTDNKLTELTQENIINSEKSDKLDKLSKPDKPDKKRAKTNEMNESESSCSSRYSNTESDKSNSDPESESESESETDEESSDASEDEIYVSINKFPVQTIAMECCDDTLDSYIINTKIRDDEWESIVLQILFTLITYQKVYNFTHNDLHTNNIVYIITDKKFIYYKYDNKHYKVPTFGKIYKIIDFGRAIYNYKGKLICSDSYAEDGDANSQYNCEPYLNQSKPRIDPNFSFDLCRLGCSLFDYFIEDLENIKKLKSPIKKIMVTWVFDDNNKNILYKNNGDERYPDFKLYKMIARTVHNHTPQKVLLNPLFDKYTIARKKINTTSSATIINIDSLPVMV